MRINVVRLLDEPVYTLEEIAAWLRVEPPFLLSECRRGRLLLRRMGSMLKVSAIRSGEIPRDPMPPPSKGPHLVQLKPGGNWYITWADGHGKSPRRSTGTEDFEAANRILNRTLSNPVRKDDGPLVADILALYARDRIPKFSSQQTPRLAIAALTEAFGDRPAEALRRDEIEAFYKHPGKNGGPIAPTGRARQLTVLRAALNYARREGVIRTVPAVPVVPPAPPRERFLTKPEARRLLEAAAGEPHVELFIELALATAARPGALFDLTWDRVDLKKARIDLQPLSRPRTTKGRPVVPIPPELVDRLQAVRISRDEQGRTPVHVIEFRGKPVRSIKRAFRGVAAAANLPDVIPYTLRHTAATWMAEAGVPVAMIAQMLGQSILRTTERYIKHHPDYLREAMQALRLQRKKGTSPAKRAGNGVPRETLSN